MLTARSFEYVGTQYEHGFTGKLNDERFFISISAEEGITQEGGERILQELGRGVGEGKITSHGEFESVVSALIVRLNMPAHINLSMGYLYRDVLYVKTLGEGQIYFRRGRTFDLLLSGDKSASGYLEEFDLAIFTTSTIKTLLGEVHDIMAFVDLDSPEDIVERMKLEEYAETDRGFVGLFVEYVTGMEQVENPSLKETTTSTGDLIVNTPVRAVEPPVQDVKFVTEQPEPITTNLEYESGKKNFSLIKLLHLAQSRRVMLIIVAFLFALLLWSVVFGLQRRQAAALQKEIETTTNEISVKLTQAEEQAYLDPDVAVSLISQARSMLSGLKEKVGRDDDKRLISINNKISESEAKILKREDKSYKEYFDLGLEDKTAKGSKIYLNNTSLAILDSTNAKAYILDLGDKSLTEYSNKVVEGATDIAVYDKNIFFLKKDGVYRFDSQTKSTKVISSEGWTNITDMEIYNGNIYLLDGGTGDIHKYLVAEKGYSEAASYFGSSKPQGLKGGLDLAIDSAVYITLKNNIQKFLQGAPDEFKTQYPSKTPVLSGFYTEIEGSSIYTWEPRTGTVYILAKDGEYLRQISSSIIAKAKDIVFYNKMLLVFDGVKLYSISLD